MSEEEEERCWDELRTECWEIILDFLNEKNYLLEPISLVCKRFLSISNCVRSRLNITGPTTLFYPSISPLLQRFHHLKRLDLDQLPSRHFRGDFNHVLLEIARSELRLEALNLSNWSTIPLECFEILGEKMRETMKVLICSVVSLGDVELKAIAISLPLLEELDISYPRGDYNYHHRDPSSGMISDNNYLARDSQVFLKLRQCRCSDAATEVIEWSIDSLPLLHGLKLILSMVNRSINWAKRVCHTWD